MFWIAEIATDETNIALIQNVLPTTLVIESRSTNRFHVGHPGWGNTQPFERLLCVRALIMMLADLDAHRDCSLTFPFSGQTTLASQAPALLQAWEETGDPPVFSIIALVLGVSETGHRTNGLTAFVGYELSARFLDEADSRDAARDLARLARYILMNGDIQTHQEFVGVNGRIVILKHGDHPPTDGYWIFRI
jgi:hypothetical protein